MLILHEEELDFVCGFYSRPVIRNRNIQYGINSWTCEKDKEAGNLWSVLQRKPLRQSHIEDRGLPKIHSDLS